jgi:ubiquinone/menaquinone biosynthesis C-methylase UbiE
MPAFLTRAAYHTQQASLRFPLLAAHAGLRLATARGKQPAPEDLRALQRAYFGLLEKDLRNAEAGLYPRSLLFQIPLTSYARKLPRLLTDLPRTYLRFRRRNYRDLPDDVDVARYPAYFRRTFHWQTDGYLSRRSAELYDLSVEFLFLGCADVMRRQVIPPLARVARRARGRRLRILDVGCGTGRTLAQIAAALPGHQYVGVDLSPFYLETARKELANVAEVTLLADNAEKLPFRDGYFDAVTSVYLFHELPRRARRRVAHEMARVLRPGGSLVVEDSAQLAEASDLAFFLDGFAGDMHEPFYRDYVRDDLAGILAEAGLEVAPAERCWLSKVVAAKKSGGGRSSSSRSD